MLINSIVIIGICILYIFFLSRSNKKYFKYLLIIPAVILLFSVTIFPTIYSFRASLYDVTAITLYRPWEFVGLTNYKNLLSDPLTWKALILTGEYIFFAVLIEFVLGILFALLFDKVRGIFLSLFLLPMMVTPIVAGLIWKYFFNVDNGFINIIARQLGGKNIPWLTYELLPIFKFLPNSLTKITELLNLNYAFFTVLVVDIWQWTSMMTLLLYAGIRSIPTEPYEAALVDGASKTEIFRYITFPLLKPTIAVALLIRLIDSYKVYDPIWALLGEGFKTVNIYLSVFLFRIHDYGQGSALSIIVLILVSCIVPLLFKVLTSREGVH